jgi:hypothetical protein
VQPYHLYYGKKIISVCVISLNDGMGKIPATAINERREKVWFLMLKGNNPQSIIKTLGSTQTVIYNDIKFLTEKSKQYMYDMAKGTHVLMYQRAIEGISLTLARAWDKFNDPKVPETQKVSYLRLTKECNESMFEFTANGPTEMAVLDIMRRANKLGLDCDHNNNNNNNKNKSNRGRGLTLKKRAFYTLQSIDGTQRIIDECMTRYKKDQNIDALKIALDGYVQLGEMLKIVKEMSSYGHSFDYGR